MKDRILSSLLLGTVLLGACSEPPVSPARVSEVTPNVSPSATIAPLVLTGTSTYTGVANHVVFVTSGNASWDDIRISHGTTRISENFNTGSWNATNFELANIANPGSAASGAYRSAGTSESPYNKRGGLRTVLQFAPSTLTPLRIYATLNSGSFGNLSFLGWRSTGLPGGGFAAYNEPGTGVLLRMHNFNSGQTNLVTPTGNITPEAKPGNALYLSGPVRISILDNGSSVSVTIGPLLPLSTPGFLPPVSTTATNTVKGGSTVPLKFQVLRGEEVISDLGAVSGFSAVTVSCGGLSSTGAAVAGKPTTLRYDADDEHFILNWRVPRTAGCYRATINLDGGASTSAYFFVR